jgi:hypothetical protein
MQALGDEEAAEEKEGWQAKEAEMKLLLEVGRTAVVI